jgi:hypothetical protein
MRQPVSEKMKELFSLVRMGPDAWAGLFCTPSAGHHTTAFPSRTRLTTFCTPPVDRIANPREIAITHYAWVVTIYKDYLVPFLSPVLADPVRIEDFHVGVPP